MQLMETEPAPTPMAPAAAAHSAPAGATGVIAPGGLAAARTRARIAQAGSLLDAGWLFLIAGLALLAAAVLIPAQKEVEEARYLRDRALALESHRGERLKRHEEYLEALKEQQPALVLSLAAGQLNQIPADRQPIGVTPEQVRATASVFPALEPPPLVMPERREHHSILDKWTSDEKSRIWVIAAGSVLVLIGLLPPTVSRRG
jgi:hypothetical protein